MFQAAPRGCGDGPEGGLVQSASSGVGCGPTLPRPVLSLGPAPAPAESMLRVHSMPSPSLLP